MHSHRDPSTGSAIFVTPISETAAVRAMEAGAAVRTTTGACRRARIMLSQSQLPPRRPINDDAASTAERCGEPLVRDTAAPPRRARELSRSQSPPRRPINDDAASTAERYGEPLVRDTAAPSRRARVLSRSQSPPRRPINDDAASTAERCGEPLVRDTAAPPRRARVLSRSQSPPRRPINDDAASTAERCGEPLVRDTAASSRRARVLSRSQSPPRRPINDDAASTAERCGEPLVRDTAAPSRRARVIGEEPQDFVHRSKFDDPADRLLDGASSLPTSTIAAIGDDKDEDGEERSGGRTGVHQTSCGATDIGSSVALEGAHDENATIRFTKDAEAALLRHIMAAAPSRRPPPQTRRRPPAAVVTPIASAIIRPSQSAIVAAATTEPSSSPPMEDSERCLLWRNPGDNLLWRDPVDNVKGRRPSLSCALKNEKELRVAAVRSPASHNWRHAFNMVVNLGRKKYYDGASEVLAAMGPPEVTSKQEPAPPPTTDASVQTALAVRDSQRPALPEKATTAVPSQLSQSARLSELPLVDFVSHHSSSHDASVLITDKGTLVQPQPWMAFPTPLRPQLLPRRSSLSIDSDFRNQQRCLPLHNSPPSSPESRFRIIDTAPFMQPPPPRSSGSARESPRERRRVHFEFVSTLEDRRSTQELLVSTAKPALLEEDDVSFQSWVRVSPRSSADQQRALPLFDRSYATTTTLTSPTPVQRVPALPTRPVTIGTPNAAAGEGGRHGRQRHSRKSANATW